jgi:hypothetical protein
MSQSNGPPRPVTGIALVLPKKKCEHDLINASPGNSSVNLVQHTTIDEAVFSMLSALSSGGTVGLCNPFLSNGSVKTFLRIRPCYENSDVINNRNDVFHGVCAECL